MTNKQMPEALWLAECLEELDSLFSSKGACGEAAAELRRQHAEIERLREVKSDLFDALEEIALAGMSGTGQESEEGMRDWHARRAWQFIGMAARVIDAARKKG